jgi:hypothetical protein
MKGFVHLIRMASALLGLAAAFAFPHAVRAQDVARGSFVLPFEVQWQGKTLWPGVYHFRLPARASGQILYVRDAQNRGRIMVVTGVMNDFSGPSALTIVERNGRRYVSSLALEEIGTKLEYSAPSQKTEAGRPTQASVQIILVQINRS